MMTQDDGFLRDQINRYKDSKRQIDEAQRPASSDTTTGLFNRGVGEGYLRLRLNDGIALTVITVHVNTADEDALRCAGQTLAEFNGIFEMICGWDTRQFLLITAADIRPGDIVARIKRQLRAADITDVRFAIARSQPGDRADDFVAKLGDQFRL